MSGQKGFIHPAINLCHLLVLYVTQQVLYEEEVIKQVVYDYHRLGVNQPFCPDMMMHMT